MYTNPFDQLIEKVRSVDLDRRRHWYVFRAFNVYRLILATVLLGIFQLRGNDYFGTEHPNLFFWVCAGYLGFIVLALVGSWRRRPSFTVQSVSQALVDIVTFSLLGIASGSSDAAMAALLIVAIAAGGIMLPLATLLTLSLAAWTFMLCYKLYEAWIPFSAAFGAERFTPEVLSHFANHAVATIDLGWLATVGGGLVGAGLVTHFLAERTRRQESSVNQELHELLELSQLNHAITQHIPAGLIVVDRYARIRLLNTRARQLLNFSGVAEDMALSDVSPLLSQRLATWLSISLNNPRPFRQEQHLADITPAFNSITFGKRSGDTLILLEDSAQAAQRLQQIKLVALGRLTASIAHEVRNPLASISHAAQLLQESPTASSGDKRLGHIIHDNAKRANVIIANVLDLSRREKAKPEEFMLEPWLDEFRQEFLRGHGDPLPDIRLSVSPPDLVVRFDANHLRQVLWNLFTNACTHGTPQDSQPLIKVQAQLDPSLGFSRPTITVRDSGEGISSLESQRIFEPFFTTKAQGAGLGLYVSREICEANRSQLQYILDDHGSSFRITFPAISKHEKHALRAIRRVALN